MTVILLLRGLHVEASTEDIRSFFSSLHIPDGGVYIVGGSLREAFIAFSTERDAQLAMRRTGSALKGSPVTLHISSMAELEQKLKSLLKKKSHPNSAGHVTTSPREDRAGEVSSPVYDQQEQPRSNTPDVQPMDASTAFYLGMCTVLQGLQTSAAEAKTPEQTSNSRPGYVRLFGLPASTSKVDICHFFQGLAVQEAIVNVKLGVNHGCLVKFAKMRDAYAALGFNEQSLGSICVQVRGADEKMWNGALQECGKRSDFQTIQKPDQHDYIVMVKNLPENMTKTDIKQLFGCPNIPHRNVLHLLDHSSNRTDQAFVIFNSKKKVIWW
uniref:RRM domain-containing protein n=1 Tax=Nothobranchius furzeri TaxID=105023 RepID=A0A8C6LSZ8_NOTFU